MACTAGLMDVSMKGNGCKTKCTAVVCIPGETAEGTRVSTSTTRSMGMACILGLTGASTTVLGQMECEMGRGSTS